MFGPSVNDNRQIIPRWRTFRETVRTGELSPTGVKVRSTHAAVSADFLSQRRLDWERYRTVGHATDLVSAALTLEQQDQVGDAARFLLQDDLSVSRWARELARNALGVSRSDRTDPRSGPAFLSKEQVHMRIKMYRQMLRSEPNDPINWVELARNHAIAGHKRHAERSIITALQLARSNRFIVRVASRFWMHEKEFERAHRVVLDAEFAPFDPWLTAVEIAIGSIRAGRPLLVKNARGMLASDEFSNREISELASAMATLELQSGSFSKSKKLFRRSLIAPTENSIAQAVWASRRHKIPVMQPAIEKIENTHEARTLESLGIGNWNAAVRSCEFWYRDQPFSKRPTIGGSFVAATALQDYPKSIHFAESGIRANPLNFTLINNLAFSAACNGDIERACKVLSRISKSKLSREDLAVFKATEGLISFRTNQIETARKLYGESHSISDSLNSDVGRNIAAIAATFQAIEEFRIGMGRGEAVRRMALRALKRINHPIVSTLITRLNQLTGDDSTPLRHGKS